MSPSKLGANPEPNGEASQPCPDGGTCKQMVELSICPPSLKYPITLISEVVPSLITKSPTSKVIVMLFSEIDVVEIGIISSSLFNTNPFSARLSGASAGRPKELNFS